MGQTDRATWAKHVECWGESGVSAEKFANQVGISPSSLKWWKWRLAAEAKGLELRKEHGQRRLTRTSSAEAMPLTFVEIAPSVSRSAQIEIVLPSRVRIRVGSQFEAAALERVLELLERRK
jgi:hypothetical protein